MMKMVFIEHHIMFLTYGPPFNFYFFFWLSCNIFGTFVFAFLPFSDSVLCGIISVETYVQNFKVIALLLKAS